MMRCLLSDLLRYMIFRKKILYGIDFIPFYGLLSIDGKKEAGEAEI
ncbi:MAG: hypothetical protein ACOYI4_09650 [Christensenellales bacterium]